MNGALEDAESALQLEGSKLTHARSAELAIAPRKVVTGSS